MSVYVTPMERYRKRNMPKHLQKHGEYWSYMTADTQDELREMARKIGVPERAKTGAAIPFYPLSVTKWRAALHNGAELKERTDF